MQLYSVACEAVENPRALSSIRHKKTLRGKHKLKRGKMLGVKESSKARNGNRGKRESRRRESSRAGDLSSSRSLKTLRKVWARVSARAGVCARAPYSQSPADMTSGMELLLEHTCGAEPLNQRQKIEELRSDVWIWLWGSSVKMSDKCIHHK